MDMGTIMVGLIYSAIGLYALRRGKQDVNFPLMLCGLLLLVVPSFVGNVWLALLVGAVLCWVAWYFR